MKNIQISQVGENDYSIQYGERVHPTELKFINYGWKKVRYFNIKGLGRFSLDQAQFDFEKASRDSHSCGFGITTLSPIDDLRGKRYQAYAEKVKTCEGCKKESEIVEAIFSIEAEIRRIFK